MNDKMRQKPANEFAVKKIEAFLHALSIALKAGEPANFSSRQKRFNVSNSTTSACKALGFIKKKEVNIFGQQGMLIKIKLF